MSVFAGHDISLNKYHYVFYSFSKSEPNTLKAQFYDSGQNLLGTQNISFSQRDIPAMLTFLENSQSNPYSLGKSPSGFRNMDIAFSGIYKKTLKDSQQQSLMTYVNKTFKNVYSNAVTVYDVKVNGSMYMIDDVEQPNLLALQTGIYVFDQSDPSNDGYRLKFRNLSDSTPYTTNVIHEGTPGTPNSYSIIDVTQSTPDLEYYCEVHTGSMYGEFKTLTDLTSYRVKVETNALGDPVFALSPPGTSEYYNQIDVSFGAGSKFLFDVSDPTMADISLVFGTVIDNSSTIIDSFVTYQDGLVMLDICSGYVGDSLKYFEDTSAGMGYYTEMMTDIIPISYTPVLYNPIINAIPSMSSTPRAVSSTLSVHWQSAIDADYVMSGHGRWIPANDDTNPWIYLDLTSIQGVLGVMIQPGYVSSWTQPTQYVKTLEIEVSIDKNTWTKVSNDDGFTWNTDISSLTTDPTGLSWGKTAWKMALYFTNGAIDTQYVKIIPKTASSYSAIRFGVIYDNLPSNPVINNESLGSNYTEVYSLPTQIPIYVTNYSVTVSNNVLYIDGSANPNLTFTSGDTYVFDLSHNSNTGNTLVLGTVPDSSTNLIDYQTIVGTPGQPGAYTTFTASGETVYYYSFETPNMGYVPITSISLKNSQSSNYDVSVSNGITVLKFMCPDTNTNSSHEIDVTFNGEGIFNYVAVGAGGSGGRTGSNSEYCTAGGNGGFVIDGTYSVTSGHYIISIPSKSGETLRSGNNMIGIDGGHLEFRDSTSNVLIKGQGGNGGNGRNGGSTFLDNTYASTFVFNGVTYERYNNQGKGGEFLLSNGNGNNGYDGKTVNINGTDYTFGGGGGGSGRGSGSIGGSGGLGGGGDGMSYETNPDTVNFGSNHTGGGGGGCSTDGTNGLDYSRGGSGVMYMWGNFEILYV